MSGKRPERDLLELFLARGGTYKWTNLALFAVEILLGFTAVYLAVTA